MHIAYIQWGFYHFENNTSTVLFESCHNLNLNCDFYYYEILKYIMY